MGGGICFPTWIRAEIRVWLRGTKEARMSIGSRATHGEPCASREKSSALSTYLSVRWALLFVGLSIKSIYGIQFRQ